MRPYAMANATCRVGHRVSNAKGFAIVTHLRLRRGASAPPTHPAGVQAVAHGGWRRHSRHPARAWRGGGKADRGERYVRRTRGVAAPQGRVGACVVRGLQTLGRCVEYLSALSLLVSLSGGLHPPVTRVEQLRRSCLTAGVYHTWSGFAALTCRRGGGGCLRGGVADAGAGGCGVFPPACPRVARTLGR